MTTFLKTLIKPMATGLVITLLLTATMVWMTINFQIILVLGALMFYVGGRYCSRVPRHWLVLLLWISWSFILLFALLVLNEIPKLYYIPLCCLVACVLGLLYTRHKKVSLGATVLLVVALALLGWKVIPSDLQNSLSEQLDQPLPDFVISDMEGTDITSNTTAGHIVVFDFFGTWCKPCIQELKELDKVKAAFQEDGTVQFYVVNADLGGDTPEKFKRFIARQDYDFIYAYDNDSTFFNALGFEGSGLPLLIIVNEQQQIKYAHIGYNAAETNFKDHLIAKIKELQKE